MNPIKLAKLKLATKLLDKLIDSSLTDGSLKDEFYTTNEKGERVLTPEALKVLDELRNANTELKEIVEAEKEDDED